jgi:3-oxoacyl-[acyl-carrier protein] reductase
MTTHQGDKTMDMELRGRNALVCGASKGLGRACAEALAREGVNVVLVARGAEALQTTAQAIRAESGTTIVEVAADITTPAGRQQALEAAAQLPNGAAAAFDIVVTNAGGPPPGNFREWDVETWQRALNANMLTSIELMRATVDGMMARGWGRIVNITSSTVKAPSSYLGLSNGARAGLTGFVAGLAREVAPHGVTINNLLPGPFATDRLRNNMALAADKEGTDLAAYEEARRQTVPAGRFGNPEEFGAACAFLCSAHAGFIVGQNILLDGGAYPGTF